MKTLIASALLASISPAATETPRFIEVMRHTVHYTDQGHSDTISDSRNRAEKVI